MVFRGFLVAILILSKWVLFLPNALAEDVVKNHPFSTVKIPYAQSELGGCSYRYSPVNFCDDNHIVAIEAALQTEKPNFFKHYIVLRYSEYPEFHQRSVIIIDANTGYAYPLPIDVYSGFFNGKGRVSSDGILKYSLSGNGLCVRGAILVYKAIQQGDFCFNFDGNKFSGFHTEYMYN